LKYTRRPTLTATISGRANIRDENSGIEGEGSMVGLGEGVGEGERLEPAFTVK
jgi:hypothetical protein